ncbi:transient receptor potential cation channel subfamily V member 1-like [Polymixia lowei]
MSRQPASEWRLERDNRPEEERLHARAEWEKEKRANVMSVLSLGCLRKTRATMDSNNLEEMEKLKPRCRFKTEFGMENKVSKPAHKAKKSKTIDRIQLFDDVASGDVTKLKGLKRYLRQNGLRLSDSLFKTFGKTVLMKALLNLREGQNDMVEYLLDISERIGDIKDLVNAAYTDADYKGQTALHIAIERRSIYFVEKLVQKGADVNAKACGKFFQLSDEPSFYFGELPLSLAACTNQPEMVNFLLDNNYQSADASEQDSHGNTVLHTLVLLADNTNENTEFITTMYDHILTFTAKKRPDLKLEDIPNKDGMTPLKLAAKTGKIELLKHILHREFLDKETKHLSRKFTEWAYGPIHSSLYDLKSLDTYNDDNSILDIIVYNSNISNRPEMLQVEPLWCLIKEKWNQFARKGFLFHFLVYLLYLSIFTAIAYKNVDIMSPSPAEQTSERGLYVLGQLLTVIASCYFFINGILDLMRKRPKLHTLMIDGYYDVLFSMQGFFFLVSALLYIIGEPEYLPLLVMSLVLSWVNLLYFSRGHKHMGVYSVMIQKVILGDIIPFLFIYIIFLSGFSTAIVALVTEPHPQSRFYDKSLCTSDSEDNGCKKGEFKKMTFTSLELFKFTIGMGDLAFTDGYKYKGVLFLLLIFYLVLTYVLLFNMLIALMSRTVEETATESNNIWKLQKAITTLDLERSLPMWMRTRLRSGVEKDLGTMSGKQDKRWFFRVEEVNWNQWNSKINLRIMTEEPLNRDTSQASDTTTEPDKKGQGFLRNISQRTRQQMKESTDSV